MAEALLRRAASEQLEVASAGSNPAGYVHPLAIKALEEVSLDISSAKSKHLDQYLDLDVDTVITVCGNADQGCPTFPGQVHRHHWPFDDPAQATGSLEEKLAEFRRVRDELNARFVAYARDRLKEDSSN